MTEEEKITEMIEKYEKLGRIDVIENKITKTIDKIIKKKWRLKEWKFQKTNFRDYEKNLFIEDWGTTDTGKYNVFKIAKLIKLHNETRKNTEYEINIEKIRTHEGREELKNEKTQRGRIMETLYEEINERQIQYNIRKREIYLEDDIGIMITRILEKNRQKIDMSGLIKIEEGKITIEKDKETIKQRVHDHYKKWTRERHINLDEIEYDYEWREIYEPKEDVNEKIYDKLMEPIKMEELNEVISKAKTYYFI
jgi:hypothetical protein